MRIGVDLGGTKIEAVVLGKNGEIVVRRRIATPKGSYRGTVTAVAQLVEMVAQEAKVAKEIPVGIGIPGTLSAASGLVKNANSVCLIGQPLDKDLAQALKRPVRLANDANCFALSEAIDGAGAGYRVVFGVILGTGVGAGVVVEGQLLSGRQGIAGEWGHNPLPWPQKDEWPGEPCYCGQRGCIETFLSGPALARSLGEQGDHLQLTKQIVARAEQGDILANQCLIRYENRLARALASVINIVDPDVIVLGGGLSHIDRLYTHIPPLLAHYVFSDTVTTPILPAQFGDSSGVRGAAWLWPLQDENRIPF
ncbi:MAG: ROK family protein [Magnetococcus sp. DMHC-6]